ncbi:MAG: ATP-dependent DNA helicase RecG [Planctomycetota bacterium]|jgi:ATP-dependent DNA helicase RecG
MSATSPINLQTPIDALPGIGRRRAAAFRHLGIRGTADLLRHLPSRYERDLGEMTISDLHGLVERGGEAGANASVTGEVAALRTARGRTMRMEATLEDATGTVRLTWFNARWLQGKLHPGMHIRVSGKVTRFGEYVQMVNPRWALVSAEEPDPLAAVTADAGAEQGPRARPIYPASEELTSRTIEMAVDAMLEPVLARLEDHLPEQLRAERGMPSLPEAYRMVHRPRDEADAAAGRERLAYDELLLLQLGVMMKRRHRREALRAPALRWTTAIDEHITSLFPFDLTNAQRRVVEEIAGDLQNDVPMNRLLQGDVGAGKTAVALYAMLMAVSDGHQAAILAPTSILAEQHAASIAGYLEGGQATIELLTGATKAAARRDILARLAAGEVDLIVGTHALLSEGVEFKNLALAVIDEQHRFGVHQRATVRDKQADTRHPHVLVMTATPIPRTLSLTIFGDLDVSVIDELPPGRTPIDTRLVDQGRRDEVYEWIAERVATGQQAYVVVPVVDESSLGLADVQGHLEMLGSGPLRTARVAGMHGRLPRDEREVTMNAFRAGEIDVLVATTVIEVGVDVPNASLMVIEHAERFGLAQLHQLRGRIGRGAGKSVCLLLGDPTTDEASARLAAIRDSTDGFVIAEKDLEIRGPGELFGARQSGLAPFRVAVLPRDLELLNLARADAEAWIARSPVLGGEDEALLRRRLLKAHGEALGLGDVG